MSLGITEKVLLVLEAAKEPLPTGCIGERLWGDGTRMPQHYARPAGKLLNRLLAAGLVVRVHRGGKDFMGWAISAAGRRNLDLSRTARKIGRVVREVVREEVRKTRSMSAKESKVSYLRERKR